MYSATFEEEFVSSVISCHFRFDLYHTSASVAGENLFFQS